MPLKSRSFAIMATVAVIQLGLWTRLDGSTALEFRPDTEKMSLVNEVTEHWNTITNWQIEYEAVHSSLSKVKGFPVHRIIAVSAPDSLYTMTAHFPGHPWQVDPYCQELFIYKGRTCHRWPFNRTQSEGEIGKGDAIPGAIWKEVIFNIIPRWPLTEFKMIVDQVSGSPIVPIELLRSSDCHLLTGSERLAGEDCAIFDSKGIERIWLATNKGLCVMRRDIRDIRSGKLLTSIIVDKVNQVASGLWLPIEFRNISYLTVDGKNESPVEKEIKVCILRFDLNERVSESVFIPRLRPGYLSYDKDNTFTQVSPGGEDLLTDIVNFMVKYAHLPSKPVPRTHPLKFLVVGLGSGLCAGLISAKQRNALKNKK